MENVKIVIGANFGDEGKGLMTDYFANEAGLNKESCLVVCHNGGSQKGHTVVSPTGLRHVFHHFGAGSASGADTYLSSDYIVNPIIFNKELLELGQKNIVTKVFVDGNAIITTPFDMMINQIAEEYRGKLKHGSCGLGIFETVLRNSNPDRKMTVLGFTSMPDYEKRAVLDQIVSCYLPFRLKQLGIRKISEEWAGILNNKEIIIDNYIDDFHTMSENITIAGNDIFDYYRTVIFEGSQGLLLDQSNVEYAPHLTPSNTGIKNPMLLLEKRDKEIEVCYVTRTYMTRHGAGRFDSECPKAMINPDITDLTNTPNPYQDTIRYGMLDFNLLKKRIESDCAGVHAKKSLAVTHCNEHSINENEIQKLFEGYRIYFSYGMTQNDIR